MIKVADLFCGAGGTSTGAERALRSLGFDVSLTAVNHWEIAISTHSANFGDARHLCTGLDNVDPRRVYAQGELDLLLASPECTHHSVARGGRPVNDQSRSTAWAVVRWAEALRPKVIIVENVPEFQSWGPVGDNGRPLAAFKGATFRAWIAALRSLGYRVDWRLLCAADYGDPTTRRRMFVQAVRGRRKIVWPDPTHCSGGESTLYGDVAPWRGAREVIDWSLAGESIFTRKRPLALKTLKRIEAGLRKYGLEPFVANVAHGNSGKKNAAQWNVGSLDAPLGAVTTATEKAVVRPFLIEMRGTTEHHLQATNMSCEAPLGTVTSGGIHYALIEPFVVSWDNQSSAGGYSSAGSPLSTITTKARHGVCEPFLIPQQSAGVPRAVGKPVPTVSTAGAISLVQPFLIEYYGNGGAQGVDEPLPTATTKQRFALVRPEVEVCGKRYLLDIRFRMLQPHELAAAQGFPADYRFSGNKTEIVKQIGNAVPCGLACALIGAVWSQRNDFMINLSKKERMSA